MYVFLYVFLYVYFNVFLGNGEELGLHLLRGVSRGPRTPSLPRNFTPLNSPFFIGKEGVKFLVMVLLYSIHAKLCSVFHLCEA